jgi:two-component system sensor histidine kinase BarA
LKLNKYIRRYLRGEHAHEVPVELQTKSGETRKFALSTLPYHYDLRQKGGFIALLREQSGDGESGGARAVRDNEDQGKEIVRLHKSHEMLKNKMILRQDFLKELAKKFKIPIHVVLGYSSLLKKDLNDILDESQLEDLDIIRDHIMFVLTMLEKAVEYFQLDDGEIQYLPEPCKVRPMLDELFERLTPYEVHTGVSFEYSHQVLSVDMEVKCDLPLLENLLRHIIDNALDYTRSGQIQLGAYEEEGHLWITVKDTGVGIDDPDRAFEPFYQDDLEHPPESRGLGLGLPIVRMYAAPMDAQIRIEHREKGGTTVMVGIPLEHTD